MVEFILADKKLKVGGMIAFHYLWMPSLRKLLRYILRNRDYANGVIKSPTRSVASVTAEILGDISYPLYLIHIPVFMSLTSVGLQSAVLLYASSVFASFTMYWFIDLYSRKRKTSSHGSVAGQTAPPRLSQFASFLL